MLTKRWSFLAAAGLLAAPIVLVVLDRAAPSPAAVSPTGESSSLLKANVAASREASVPAPTLVSPALAPGRDTALQPPGLDRHLLQQKIGYLLQTEHLVRLGAYVESLECKDDRCIAELAVPRTSEEARSKGAAAVVDIMDEMKADLQGLGLKVAVRSVGQSDRGLALSLDVHRQGAERQYVLSEEELAQIRMETLKQAGKNR